MWVAPSEDRVLIDWNPGAESTQEVEIEGLKFQIPDEVSLTVEQIIRE